jgi:hypothetical protein
MKGNVDEWHRWRGGARVLSLILVKFRHGATLFIGLQVQSHAGDKFYLVAESNSKENPRFGQIHFGSNWGETLPFDHSCFFPSSALCTRGPKRPQPEEQRWGRGRGRTGRGTSSTGQAVRALRQEQPGYSWPGRVSWVRVRVNPSPG